MKSKWMLFIVMFFVVCNLCNAQLCRKIKLVSAGEAHTLALMEDNSLMSCGNNILWQLGIGPSRSSVYTLQKVKGINGNGFLQGVTSFDAGWKHSLAVANGTLISWGYDSEGQLGNGGTGETDSNVPQKVKALHGQQGYLSDTKNIVYVSAGRSGTHSLVVDSSGYVFAFGNNGDGQCGIGHISPHYTLQDPCQVVGESGSGSLGGTSNKIIAVEAGIYHSLALSQIISGSGGNVWEWGNGTPTPYRVPNFQGGSGNDLHNIVCISSCGHSVAVDSDGYVYEWYPGNTPQRVPNESGQGFLSNIKAVSAGAGYTIALGNNGRVWKWLIGDTPVPIPAGQMLTSSGYLEDINAVAAGYADFQLAVDHQGFGWGWSAFNGNYDGELGVGDNDIHPAPVMMACPEVSKTAYLTMTYTIEGYQSSCARPFMGNGINDNYLKFTISYGNPTTNTSDPNYMGTLYDVNIIDVLPAEVDFNSVTGNANYHSNDHTVTLNLSTLSPGETGSFTITTKVNDYACPGGFIHNDAELSAYRYYTFAEANVPVCNWGGNIIYVDKDATSGYKNGTSWNNAYLDLQKAFAAAKNIGSGITAIWVAAGTYKPVEDIDESGVYRDKSFELLDNLAVIGHFGGIGTYETSPNQRNLADANNTILEGKIGSSSSESVYYVVKANNISNALLDGFTIQDSRYGAGIYLEDADVSIVNCQVIKNNYYGIYAISYSYPDIHNCIIADNASTGCYSNNHCQPAISYSVVDGNNVSSRQGLYMSNNCAVTIDNSIFRNNANGAVYGTGNGSLTVTASQFTNNYEGFNLSDITTTISNSAIKSSTSKGITATNSDLYISKSLLSDNSNNGIYASNGCNVSLQNSIVRRSGGHGLNLTDNTTTNIKNCWIHKNGTQHDSYFGGAAIYLASPTQTPFIRNNTIFDNWTYGMQANRYGPDPNVQNCIVYGNDTNDFFRETGGSAFSKIKYCCLQHNHSGIGNFIADPTFANQADVNDLHIADNSPCINTGDPNACYAGETDIDGERRVADSRADIGGDEYFWSKADFNNDGIVNFKDFSILANTWQIYSGQNHYNEICDINDNNHIDVNDLQILAEDWLWESLAASNWMQSMDYQVEEFDNENMSMMNMENNFSLMSDISIATNNSLMIADVQISNALRPARLARKTDKFYAITEESVAASKNETEQIATGATRTAPRLKRMTSTDVRNMLNCLDNLWQNSDMSSHFTQQQYDSLVNMIESAYFGTIEY